MRRLVAAAVTVAALLSIGTATAAPVESNLAPCEKAIIGHGPADWRNGSTVAGPVGVRRQPLRDMSLSRGWYTTKLPILVEGREPETVTVSVPPRLRHRVFLIYGEVRDRDGNPSFSFRNTRGYGETEFQPCGNKPRTIWPGGIKVKGDKPVSLDVFTSGRNEPFILRLGKPRAYEQTIPRHAPDATAGDRSGGIIADPLHDVEASEPRSQHPVSAKRERFRVQLNTGSIELLEDSSDIKLRHGADDVQPQLPGT